MSAASTGRLAGCVLVLAIACGTPTKFDVEPLADTATHAFALDDGTLECRVLRVRNNTRKVRLDVKVLFVNASDDALFIEPWDTRLMFEGNDHPPTRTRTIRITPHDDKKVTLRYELPHVPDTGEAEIVVSRIMRHDGELPGTFRFAVPVLGPDTALAETGDDGSS